MAKVTGYRATRGLNEGETYKGQYGTIVNHILEAGDKGIARKELLEHLEGLGTSFSEKQTPEKVLSFYQAKLKASDLIEVEFAPEEAKAEKPKKGKKAKAEEKEAVPA